MNPGGPRFAGVTYARADGMIHRMQSTKVDYPDVRGDHIPAAKPEERPRGWSTLRLLPSTVWLGLLAVLGVFLAVALIGDQSARLVATTVVGVVLLAVMARLFGAEAARQVRAREAAERQAAEFERLIQVRTRELSELSTHLQNFAEKEKSELARHLHDELGGLLTAAKMDLSWLQSRLHDAPYGERLGQLGAVLDEAMNLKRRVVEELRPSLLDHFGLPTALRAHVESVCSKAGLQCEVTMADEADTLPKESAIALFRVIQEGLANVVRHAHARNVRLALTADSQRYLLLLSDDGCGMKMTDSTFRWSHGLAGMRHRVEALSGRFTIESSPADGTTLRVEIPRTRAADAP
jgi:signal transduction histidine kinase